MKLLFKSALLAALIAVAFSAISDSVSWAARERRDIQRFLRTGRIKDNTINPDSRRLEKGLNGVVGGIGAGLFMFQGLRDAVRGYDMDQHKHSMAYNLIRDTARASREALAEKRPDLIDAAWFASPEAKAGAKNILGEWIQAIDAVADANLLIDNEERLAKRLYDCIRFAYTEYISEEVREYVKSRNYGTIIALARAIHKTGWLGFERRDINEFRTTAHVREKGSTWYANAPPEEIRVALDDWSDAFAEVTRKQKNLEEDAAKFRKRYGTAFSFVTEEAMEILAQRIFYSIKYGHGTKHISNFRKLVKEGNYKGIVKLGLEIHAILRKRSVGQGRMAKFEFDDVEDTRPAALTARDKEIAQRRAQLEMIKEEERKKIKETMDRLIAESKNKEEQKRTWGDYLASMVGRKKKEEEDSDLEDFDDASTVASHDDDDDNSSVASDN